MDIIEQVNKYLLETEQLANEFLPLNDTLKPIQDEFKGALNELKTKAETATELSDRTFYINRYVDLVKKAEGIFDTRSKRLQQTISMLAKLSLNDKSQVSDGTEDKESTDESLTPEQASAILQVLNDGK